MSSSRKKPNSFDKPKWLIRVVLVSNATMTFSLTTRELRSYITSHAGVFDSTKSEAGLVNKYVFPCVLERLDQEKFKHIKIRRK